MADNSKSEFDAGANVDRPAHAAHDTDPDKVKGQLAPPAQLSVLEFTSESAVRHPLKLCGEIFNNVQEGRALAWRMFIRNIKALYRQTVLGLFWAFLPPIANTLLWVLLSRSGMTNFADELGSKYAVYVLAGMVLWQSFAEALQAPLNSVQTNRFMLSKLRFPRESILMVAVYEVLFNLLIRMLVLIPIMLLFGISPELTHLFVPLGAILLVFLGVGMGCFLMPFGMLYQDVGRFLLVAIPIWMIVTQIVYPPPENWASNPINWANPASPLLLLTRDLLVFGESSHVVCGVAYAVIAIPLALVGLVVYRVAVPILVERVST